MRGVATKALLFLTSNSLFIRFTDLMDKCINYHGHDRTGRGCNDDHARFDQWFLGWSQSSFHSEFTDGGIFEHFLVTKCVDLWKIAALFLMWVTAGGTYWHEEYSFGTIGGRIETMTVIALSRAVYTPSD